MGKMKHFKRDAEGAIFGGVCSAIAKKMGIDPLFVRLVFVIGSEFLFFLYMVIWLITDEE
jgi:phage shock protein PspC (stress-responsive transcriptional regulator)